MQKPLSPESTPEKVETFKFRLLEDPITSVSQRGQSYVKLKGVRQDKKEILFVLCFAELTKRVSRLKPGDEPTITAKKGDTDKSYILKGVEGKKEEVPLTKEQMLSREWGSFKAFRAMEAERDAKESTLGNTRIIIERGKYRYRSFIPTKHTVLTDKGFVSKIEFVLSVFGEKQIASEVSQVMKGEDLFSLFQDGSWVQRYREWLERKVEKGLLIKNQGDLFQ